MRPTCRVLVVLALALLASTVRSCCTGLAGTLLGNHHSIKISGVADATTSTIGSLLTAGGIGVSKNANVGGTLKVAGASTLAITTEASSTTSGSVIVSGGMGVSKAVWVGGLVNIGGVATAAVTTEATTSSLGSLVTMGGLGVAKNANVGGTLKVAGASTLTGVVTAAANTGSTSVSSGALISAGGLGVNQNAFVGGTLNAAGASTLTGVATAAATTEATTSSLGSLLTAGGIGVAKNANVGGTLKVAGASTLTGLLIANQFQSSNAVISGGSLSNVNVGSGGASTGMFSDFSASGIISLTGDMAAGVKINLEPGQEAMNGIPIGAIQAAAGTFTTLGSASGVVDSSDRRFKKNITSIASALDKVGALEGVQYLLRTDEFPEKQFVPTTQLGFIAQDVEEVLPELVVTAADGYKAIRYAGFAPVLTNAVNELHAEVKAQQAACQAQSAEQQIQIAEQQAQIDELVRRLSVPLHHE
jgi:hypothetical protein